jgi:hypothetical protein
MHLVGYLYEEEQYSFMGPPSDPRGPRVVGSAWAPFTSLMEHESALIAPCDVFIDCKAYEHPSAGIDVKATGT